MSIGLLGEPFVLLLSELGVVDDSSFESADVVGCSAECDGCLGEAELFAGS